MQDRYVGDIGDYGKLGLLRCLQSSGLSIGVNWYLVPDENHDEAGKYTQYLYDPSFTECDAELRTSLRQLVTSGQRKVQNLQDAKLLDAAFYSERLDFSGMSKQERIEFRHQWHMSALARLSGVDLVFVDPDNGLAVPSAIGTRRENKYVLQNELKDYYAQGASVIYYQHQGRRKDDHYKNLHRALMCSSAFPDCSGFGLKFVTTSHRYFFFLLHPSHRQKVVKQIERMLTTSWKSHFECMELHSADCNSVEGLE